jgi:hypothetical protein
VLLDLIEDESEGEGASQVIMCVFDDDSLVEAVLSQLLDDALCIRTWNHIVFLVVDEESRDLALTGRFQQIDLERIERMGRERLLQETDCRTDEEFRDIHVILGVDVADGLEVAEGRIHNLQNYLLIPFL